MVNFYTERTVRWEDGEVVLIDQSQLPLRLRYIRCRSHLEVAEAIRSMAVRGAPAIGVAAAMGMALVAQYDRGKGRRESQVNLQEAAELLASTRPTAVNLPWAIQRVLKAARAEVGGSEAVAEAVLGEAIRMADEDVANNRALGLHGASLIGDGETILTHCNWP